MFLLECCKDTLELLEVINMEMAIQHLCFPPRVQWQRLSVLRLPGFPMALDARDLQAAFPNLQHLSMPSPRMRIDGYRPQQGTDAGAWTALSSYTGHLGYLLALGGGCRVSRLFPCEEFSQWEEWAFAPALRAARPRYIALSLQDHRFAPLCEPALWAAAPELEYMALDFGNSGNPAELNGALAGLCIALRGTQITYMSLRFPSPTYHTNDDLLHSVMTSIRYAVGMGLSSLRYVEVDIHYGHHQVQGVHQLLAIRPPGGIATGVRTRDDIVFESLDVSRARSLKEVLAR
ncbi:hypothetical protein GLOTRDRAFT_134126 [Gloeophyllum trabeum ATCC 11539]|uniref:F-box domain-containing protein n=1 Tax=Gloeophyllum trabeum (strain ATCC 11539 / FP-39264 / Madison 617) TaxID=670483 RepID=S7RCW5_GLOTA|nr:uncharacterized protein GLOTRDRAFT_134126 [Gloeophyllum trabeum ATCC 11539]EPQ50254.1 hypothetical protein GLOTRDRAFT_134126 [Gloeophyllum trabeum ATCC 11539]